MGSARLRILGGIDEAVPRFVHAGRRGLWGNEHDGRASKIRVPAPILKQDAPPETRRANEESAKVLKKTENWSTSTAPGTTFITIRGSARWKC
jgi:hypothetical protein